MLIDLKIRPYSDAVSGALFAISALLAAFVPAPAAAQTGEPIKIGYSMALTGGLAPNGRSALLAQKIWEEDVNARGGLLGRPVKLIHYDDQTNPATVPGIYTKLLDIDKVDLIIGGYGTNLLAPAMPVAMQRKKVLIGLLGNAVNSARLPAKRSWREWLEWRRSRRKPTRTARAPMGPPWARSGLLSRVVCFASESDGQRTLARGYM